MNRNEWNEREEEEYKSQKIRKSVSKTRKTSKSIGLHRTGPTEGPFINVKCVCNLKFSYIYIQLYIKSHTHERTIQLFHL